MGVTLESKNCSLDFGYGGFNNIRTKVAELAADDIGEHYRHLSDAPFFEEQRKPFFEEYDKKDYRNFKGAQRRNGRNTSFYLCS